MRRVVAFYVELARTTDRGEAWELILEASVGKENCVPSPVQFPEAGF
ncbi:MAG: hypothetical protein V7K97_21705 [Nostoc sp.]